MKKILTLLLIITFFSCSTEQMALDSSMERWGVETNEPDLGIVEEEYDWQFKPNGFGILIPPSNDGTYRISYTTITPESAIVDTMAIYHCPIANYAAQDISGKNDLVINKEEEGIANGSGGYDFPGLLSITTYQNGFPVGQVIKQTFDVSPTHLKNDYNFAWETYYDEPYMAIPARTADMYINRAIVRSGKVIIVVEVNPDGLINEPNRTNNVSVLPLNVTINGTSNELLGTAVVDHTAKLENYTHPVSPIMVAKNFTGNNKNVTLTWHCPYHGYKPTPSSEPIYVNHWFTVKKNGVIVEDNLKTPIFVDKFKGRYNNSTYEIITHVPGMRASVPVTVTVVR